MKKIIIIGLILFAVLCSVMCCGCYKKKGKVYRCKYKTTVILRWLAGVGVEGPRDAFGFRDESALRQIIKDWHDIANNKLLDNDTNGDDVAVNIKLSASCLWDDRWDCPCHKLAASNYEINDDNFLHLFLYLRAFKDADAAVVKKVIHDGEECAGLSIPGIQTFVVNYVRHNETTVCHEVGHLAIWYASKGQNTGEHPDDSSRIMGCVGSGGDNRYMIVDNCPLNGNEKDAFEKWAAADDIAIVWGSAWGTTCGSQL